MAPVVTAQSVVATYQGATHTVASFTGTSSSYLRIDDDDVQAGVPFTDDDWVAHRRVALLGPTVAKDLVGGDGLAAVGTTVQFNAVNYTVIGVLAAKGSTGPNDADDRVLAPLPTVQDTLSGYGQLSSVSVQATSADTVSLAQAEVQDVLNGRHHVAAANADYSIFNASSILSAATSTTQTFTVLLGAVAAISLLVGGIGVMNIMLVTVTERTREIGIRKAVGARRSDIVGQFLFEAVLLSLFGGVVGVIVGSSGAGSRSSASNPSWRRTRSCWPSAWRWRSVSSSGSTPPAAPPPCAPSTRCATSEVDDRDEGAVTHAADAPDPGWPSLLPSGPPPTSTIRPVETGPQTTTSSPTPRPPAGSAG